MGLKSLLFPDNEDCDCDCDCDDMYGEPPREKTYYGDKLIQKIEPLDHPDDVAGSVVNGWVRQLREPRRAWKAVASARGGRSRPRVAELVIPKNSHVVYPDGGERKLRTDSAFVANIMRIEDRHIDREFTYTSERRGVSPMAHGRRFEYTVGQVARPDRFDEDATEVCTHGIHIFASKEDAARFIS